MNGDVRISGEFPQQLCHRSIFLLYNSDRIIDPDPDNPFYPDNIFVSEMFLNQS